MNIENNLYNASAYLEMAKQKIASQDYEGALTVLGKAYSHTRALLELVFKLQALKIEVESPSGNNSGGPQP